MSAFSSNFLAPALFWIIGAESRQMLVLRPFYWEIGHNTLKQSWITIKSQHFPPKKSDLGPVHLDQISDKLDYLNCPSGQIFFFHFFSIGQPTSSLGKWNWHLLNFFSFTFILAQCECVTWNSNLEWILNLVQFLDIGAEFDLTTKLLRHSYFHLNYQFSPSEQTFV